VYQKIIHKPYLYKKAADQGLPDALNSIAMMYRNGIGVPQDYSQVLYWYKILAEQAKASALVALAGMYYDGHGVTQNYKIAYILINVADMLDTAKYSALAPSYIATKLSSTELKDAERISTQLQNSRNFGIDLRKFLDSHQ
jgi:TPR repeat protein